MLLMERPRRSRCRCVEEAADASGFFAETQQANDQSWRRFGQFTSPHS